jgi:hypothetical protein
MGFHFAECNETYPGLFTGSVRGASLSGRGQ